MRKTCFILLVLLLSNLTTFSQEAKDTLFLIHGIVLDADSQEALPNTHYVLNKMFGNITDEKGRFSVYLSHNDTIKFTRVGYRDFYYSPSDTLSGRVFTAGIFLETDTLALGEVIVIPRMPDLRSSIRSSNYSLSPEMRNAQNNISASVYEGLNSPAELGDPETNYDLLKRKQTLEAYEKGAIPSSRMVGINFLAIPAAIIYYSKGMNQRPEPPKPVIPRGDIERMKNIYKKRITQNKQ